MVRLPLPCLQIWRLCTIATTISDFCVFVLMDDMIRVDLGHDDIDGQECKDGRSRTWMLLLYEDDPSHKAVLDGKLNDLDWNYAGRIHDQDEGVKPHHHVVVLFKDGRKNTDVAADLGIDKRWLRAWDRKKKALRYLCHKDNEWKFQYSTDGIYGTIAEQAVSACSKGNEMSEVQTVQDVIRIINEQDGYLSYSRCLALMCEHGCFSVFRRMGIIAVRLLDEHNGHALSAASARMNANRANAAFENFVNASIVRDKTDWVGKSDDLLKSGYKMTDVPPMDIEQGRIEKFEN